MTVVAFDIDGTLTRSEVLTAYRELKNMVGITIGIVTRRTQKLAQDFVQEHNLNPEFLKSRVVKTLAFEEIKDNIDDDEFIYVGNRISDFGYAKLSGWDFVLAQTVDNHKSII